MVRQARPLNFDHYFRPGTLGRANTAQLHAPPSPNLGGTMRVKGSSRQLGLLMGYLVSKAQASVRFTQALLNARARFTRTAGTGGSGIYRGQFPGPNTSGATRPEQEIRMPPIVPKVSF